METRKDAAAPPTRNWLEASLSPRSTVPRYSISSLIPSFFTRRHLTNWFNAHSVNSSRVKRDSLLLLVSWFQWQDTLLALYECFAFFEDRFSNLKPILLVSPARIFLKSSSRIGWVWSFLPPQSGRWSPYILHIYVDVNLAKIIIWVVFLLQIGVVFYIFIKSWKEQWKWDV